MSSFDFDFFEEHVPNKQPNLQQVMEQIDNHSFEFDQFDPVDQNAPHQHSYRSDLFKTKQPEEKGVSAKSRENSREFQLDNSRNISQISYLDGDRNRSFRYENPQENQSGRLKSNERFQKLQKMLSKAKQNNLDMFYQNLDQSNAYKTEDKFKNKEEFKHYRNQLKMFKREKETEYKQKNGNYNFNKNNQYQPTPKGRQIMQLFGRESEVDYNFKKKEGSSRNLLPMQYAQEEDGFDFFEVKPEEAAQEVEKYKEKQYIKEGELFFNAEAKQGKDKKEKKQPKLQSIREECANLFEVTHQQQKMNKLLTNYEEMKKNFNDLMLNLKQNNGDQQKIIKQLKMMKSEYENKESRMKIEEGEKKQKRMMKEKERDQKNKKIGEMKEKITQIKQNSQKDVLFLKINQKIENLEEIVKNAIQEMNQEKEQKFIPKIINYYQQQDINSPSKKSKNPSEVGLSRDNSLPPNQDDSRFDNLDQDYFLGPVRNAIKQLKQEKLPDPMCHIDQFSSPLQLDLTTNDFPLNLSRNNRSQQLDSPFVPSENSQQYLPATLQTSNKYLRKCLTQKSSVLFQSFQFYITGKFTITGNDRYPVLCQLRVANKCAINLNDVFVIVYGPQAQQAELQMRPSKIMYSEFKYGSSFLFQVDLSKSCLDDGAFSVQICYKTDPINKKKVNFKAILPFIQLIKPEFIYEQQFMNGWNHMGNQLFIRPKTLDFKNIRSHEDLKLILPFIEINESDPNAFSYGIMFSYPKSTTQFMLKITCYVNGKASIHLKNNQNNQAVDKRLRQQVLNIMNFLCFG